MIDRRTYMSSFAAACLAIGVGPAKAVGRDATTRRLLKSFVGPRFAKCGAVVAKIDEKGLTIEAIGTPDVSALKFDTRTVFEIGSITKIFTALLLTTMAKSGEVALDDPVSKYLPAKLRPRIQEREITLLDLANYRSGLPRLPGNLPPGWWANPNPFADYTSDQLAQFLSGFTPEFAPSTHFAYSSLGFALLGCALANRAEKSFEQLVVERVCRPIGLRQTRISLSENMKRHLIKPHENDLKSAPLWDFGVLEAAGALRATLADAIHFLKICMDRCTLNDASPYAQLIGTRTPTGLAGTDAALGFFVTRSGTAEVAWKTGLTDGSNAFIGFSTRQRCGVLVLANFVSMPPDVAITQFGLSLIEPELGAADYSPLYTHD